MIAMMYAESRLPGVTRAEFTARWRLHGGVALSYPTFRETVFRYVHRDPLTNLTEFPGANAEYDALGEIVTDDATSLQLLLGSHELTGPIRGDGGETFARTRTVNAIVEEFYLRDRYLAPVSVSMFLSARTDGAELAKIVRTVQEGLCEDIPEIDRLSRRIGVSASVDTDAPWCSYLDLAFDSVPDTASAYRAWAPEFAQRLGARVARQLTLVSVRCPMFDPAALDPPFGQH